MGMGRVRECQRQHWQVAVREQKVCEPKLVIEPWPNTCKLWTLLQNSNSLLLSGIELLSLNRMLQNDVLECVMLWSITESTSYNGTYIISSLQMWLCHYDVNLGVLM